MRNRFFVFLLLVCMVTGAVNGDDLLDYCHARILAIAGARRDGAFAYAVAPMNPEYLVVLNMGDWQNRRLTHSQMVGEATKIREQSPEGLTVILRLYLIDKTSLETLEIPESIESYAFLQKNETTFSRAKLLSKTDYNKVNFVQTEYFAFFLFPLVSEAGAALDDSDSVQIVVNNIGNMVIMHTFNIPFSTAYEDAPEELKAIFYDSGIWEKP